MAQVDLPLFASYSLLAAASDADPRINESEWSEFLHLPNEKFYYFNQIFSEIVRDTESKAGRNAGNSPQPINWRIFSPNIFTPCRLACINEGSHWRRAQIHRETDP